MFSIWLLLAAVASPPAPASVGDTGIFSDLDTQVSISLPKTLDAAKARLVLIRELGLLLVYEGDYALKAYGLDAKRLPEGTLVLSDVLKGVTPQDAQELNSRLRADVRIELRPRPTSPTRSDRDGDGIPNTLDVLLGARKLVVNQATYTEGYYQLGLPNGDVPRNMGVCSDTIVRALRNAGIDLQSAIADDVGRSRRAYPNIDKPDRNIDHRRVKNLFRWFERHMQRVPSDAPYKPGEIVFLDTFPSRAGADHVGIISDRMGSDGLPLVINNWTVGYVESEMELLGVVPVIQRFRLK